jgi:hypothetical protein
MVSPLKRDFASPRAGSWSGPIKTKGARLSFSYLGRRGCFVFLFKRVRSVL